MPNSEEAAEKVLTTMSFDGLEMSLGASLADLLKNGGPKTEEKRAEFQSDCAKLRKRLHPRRSFINPRRSYIQKWDIATAVALIFTATVTPFEVCAGLKTQYDALYVINTIVNFIFMVDIIIQFFLPVVDKETKELIRDHKKLAALYMRFWFWIDLFTVLPFDSMTLVAPGMFGAECGSSATLVKGVKLVRTARLFKLIRMMRSSRIIQRWDSSISISTSARTMLFAWSTWVVAMHWLACIWLLLPQLQDSYRDDPRLGEAITARLARNDSTSFECDACLCSSDPESQVCLNPCLTACEQEEMALILDWPVVAVRESQDWRCRAASKGWLDPTFSQQPALMWAFGLAKVRGTIQFSHAPLAPHHAPHKATPRPPSVSACHARHPTRRRVSPHMLPTCGGPSH